VTIAQYFRGLADESRLRVLNLLFQGELCGCDVQHVLDLSQSNVSRHLNYLKRVGLVVDRREGYRVFYRLAPRAERNRGLLFEYLGQVFDREPSFREDLKKLKDAIRDGACSVSERTGKRLSHAASAERRQAL
jgi:ArsR family transcriptional regulator